MENQNTQQNDIYELLKKVVESNEENIQTQNQAKLTYLEVKKLIQSFQEKIPENVELQFDEYSSKLFQDLKRLLQEFKHCVQLQKFFFSVSIGVLVLVAIIVFNTSYFSLKWYSESIRAKSEIRQDILDEIKKDGNAIYKIDDYDQLKYNTDLMNKWMKKNPKDGEKFMKFKEGFESK